VARTILAATHQSLASREMTGVITLLTDFGLSDPFVGVMHGVILARNPDARIVDLCHGIEPHDVREGAFWAARCAPWFPSGSIHVVVVDPGVGTDRAAIALASEGHLYVGPDNGVLSGPLAQASEVHRIDEARFGSIQKSRTFHGRDLFAPVAADLLAGRLKVSDLGPVAHPIRFEETTGRVATIDRFGNLITDLEPFAELAELEIAGVRIPLADTYGEVPKGELVALVGSFGTLEIAVREGSAAARLGVGRGEPVRAHEAR
jgi:S-adenosylmethionine hydrolase